MNNENKRKKFYQKRLTLYKSIFSFFMFVGLGIAMLTVFYTVFATNIAAYLIDMYQLESPSGPIVFLSRIIENRWLYTIIGGGLLVLMSTFFTHRFAGPLYRFEVSLEQMAKKDFSFRIKLRKNDECEQLADKFNLLNRNMSEAIKSLASLADDLEQQHARLSTTLSGDAHDKLTDAMVIHRKIKSKLAAFKCQ
jgi:methyl-accepting chemotaxis protein